MSWSKAARYFATSWLIAISLVNPGATAVAAGPVKTIVSLNLSKPFASRSPWRLTATQGPDTSDTPSAEETEPGVITLCLSKDGGRTCQPRLDTLLLVSGGGAPDTFSQPHYLGTPTLLRPTKDVLLLRVDVGSLHGGNGDQRRAMALIGYDRARDSFVIAYQKATSRNNNQEIRYMAQGPLRGAVISAEPTANAPFGYWIAVNRLTGQAYQQVLHYRSATRYGDGNPLAVIDAEMPNIQQHLGRWHSGQPLPLPEKGCAKPHMVKGALWC